MKSKIKIVSVLCFVAIYCAAIGGSVQSFSAFNLGQKEVSSQEKLEGYVSTKLFFHTFLFEKAENNTSLPIPNLKNSFINVWAITKNLEALFDTLFSQYNDFSTNTLINNRKSDIIFPFHYFW